ncbi:hypothetical protein FQN60_003605 [Etheostoma spectabile]|uniref:Uncharacterized protein n=1 Tax=Etheostoma spectabile TaxID=54343 RepID=A0A5J5CZZ8_9PERO|nr:hypothetical protein FQN60_003605 [Etheostoma spectabile]
MVQMCLATIGQRLWSNTHPLTPGQHTRPSPCLFLSPRGDYRIHELAVRTAARVHRP